MLQEAPGVVAVCKRFSTQPPTSPWLPPAKAGAPGAMAAGGCHPSGDTSDISTCCESDAADGSEDGVLSDGAEQLLASSRTTTTASTVAPEVGQGHDAADMAADLASTTTAVQLQQGPEEVEVEVDVVANEGHTWIEVKNQEPFGLYSVHMVRCWCVQGE